MNGPEPVERFRAIRIVQGVIGNARSGMHAVSADAVRLSVFVGVCRGLVGGLSAFVGVFRCVCLPARLGPPPLSLHDA